MSIRRFALFAFATLALCVLPVRDASAGTDKYLRQTVSAEGAHAATYGEVLVLTSATPIPASPLGSRTNITVQNQGGVSLYCGFDSSVTANTGMEVAPKATYTASLGPTLTLYCIASVAQTSGSGTRYQETD
jgi:hypothetical protein